MKNQATHTFQEVEAALKNVGLVSEMARRAGRSLIQEYGPYIAEVRRAASDLGLSRQMQNAIEMEGAQAVR